jgi:hypothetical protein
LIEKSAGSSFTDSLPCGKPPWLLDPVAVVELASFVDVSGLSFPPAVVPAPHPATTAMHAASVSAAVPLVRAFAFAFMFTVLFSVVSPTARIVGAAFKRPVSAC